MRTPGGTTRPRAGWTRTSTSWRTSASTTASAAGRRASRAGAKARRGAGREGDPLPLSSFRWNEVIFRSFQSGNLKQLDLEFYLKLRLPTTKRMFRFLDKRFYRRDRLDFDLKTLACEHIGMSRSYKPTELKRRLRPALEELETLGFLEPSAGGRAIRLAGPRLVADHPGPGPPRPRAAEAAPAGSRGADRAADGARGRRRDGRRAGRGPRRRGDPRKVEVFDWLVKRERQAGRQEPRRLPRRLDPRRLPAPRATTPRPDEADRLAEAEHRPPRTSAAAAICEHAEADRAARKEADLKATLGRARRRRTRRDRRPGQGREPRPPPLEDDDGAPLPRRAGAPPPGRPPATEGAVAGDAVPRGAEVTLRSLRPTAGPACAPRRLRNGGLRLGDLRPGLGDLRLARSRRAPRSLGDRVEECSDEGRFDQCVEADVPGLSFGDQCEMQVPG